MVMERRAFSITEGLQSPPTEFESSSKFKATNGSITITNVASPEVNRDLSNSINAAYVVRTKDESLDICSASKKSSQRMTNNRNE